VVLAVSPVLGQAAKKPTTTAAKPATPAAKPEAGQADASPQYVLLPYDPEQRANATKVLAIVRRGKIEPNEEKMFDDYFRLYAVGSWTQSENLTQLPKLRKRITDQLQLAKTGASHSRLTDLLLEMCSQIVVGNYHPAVLVNAMLMIGGLNFEEPARPADNPTPLPSALPVMLAQLTNPKQIDAVRVAALVGLTRHSRLGIRDAATARELSQAALKILTTKSVPGRTAAGNGWMRAQAAEILGNVSAAGDTKAIAEALGQVVGDSGSAVMARRAAAQSLGRIKYSSVTGVNRETLANSLGRLAVNACQTAKADPQAAGAVRQMKSVLYACSQGIGGVAKGVESGQQAFVQQIQEKITAMLTLCNEKDVREDDVLQRIDPMADDLESVLKKTA